MFVAHGHDWRIIWYITPEEGRQRLPLGKFGALDPESAMLSAGERELKALEPGCERVQIMEHCSAGDHEVILKLAQNERGAICEEHQRQQLLALIRRQNQLVSGAGGQFGQQALL